MLMKIILLALACLALPLARTAGDILPPKEIADRAIRQVEQVSPDALEQERKANPKLLLIDVRKESEFRAGHLPGALWIPRGTLEFDLQKTTTDPDAPIVVYCRTGGRAALAALALRAVGYRNVRSLDGGFKSWAEAEKPVYNEHGKVKVIAYGEKETDPS